YPGRTHLLAGEYEAGKSWLALTLCAQEIRRGNDVAYIDFEDSLDGILSRLLDLADEDDILKHFTYIRPEEPLPGPETIDALSGKSLVIVDGVGEALSLH